MAQAHAQASEDAAAAELLKQARNALEAGLQKHVKQALFGRVQACVQGLFKVTGNDARSIRSLSKQLDKVEENMATLLEERYESEKDPSEAAKKLLQRFMGGGSSLRAELLHRTLHAASKYEVQIGSFGGSIDMIKLAWVSSRTKLVKDENELSYLLEQLTELQKLTVTDQSWKDVGESWRAMLALRSQIEVERGQAVLEIMCADEKVLQAIGMTMQIREIQGDVPNDVVTLLTKGPSNHIHSNAYKYRKMIK